MARNEHCAFCAQMIYSRQMRSFISARSFSARSFSVRLLAVVAVLLCSSVVLLAHHGHAGYEVANSVTITGTVSEFQFVNPHSIVIVTVKDEKGETQSWQAELTSPNHLIRAGWTATSLKPADQVTITGYRAKSGANSIWITKISANGEELKTGEGN